MNAAIPCVSLTGGRAEGRLIAADEALSFWGGVDPRTGEVIDRHHPLSGQSIAGRVLALPGSRGSCSGSAVLLESILNGQAPAAIVVTQPEEVLTLGALVAEELFGHRLPIARVPRESFGALSDFAYAGVMADRIALFRSAPNGEHHLRPSEPAASASLPETITLDPHDRACLAGGLGPAAQVAMRLLVRMAALMGADKFIDVSQVHVDGCIYTGPASLRVAQEFLARGARVRVPTTLNAISVDRARWRAQGVEEAFGAAATALADAYLAMGARPSFTCAPYLLGSAPRAGQHVGWAESNAVVYANSVLGARTMKYPDFLDLCVALTGRAPRAGCHLDAGRRAGVALDVVVPPDADESYWPLLGHCCGTACAGEIPLIRGLEGARPGPDELKAFGAAFATASPAPMFHMAGVTPEAQGQQPSRSAVVGPDALRRAWRSLNTGDAGEIGLVALGSPHLSRAEIARLAAAVRGRRRSPRVSVVATCGPEIFEAASRAGDVAAAEAFGVEFVTDTCWCMLGEPVVPREARTLMTDSGKYAHYAPGLVGRGVRFGSLLACVEAACSGRTDPEPPAWLDA